MTDEDRVALMAESLSEGLSALRGRTVRVRKVTRAQFDGSSSFQVQRLRVLVNDEWLDVFFKDLNPLHQLIDARLVRNPDLDRSRRELYVYKHLLPGGMLGVPALYGYRWELGKGLLWLFLEHAGPKRLSRLGDLDLWIAAARWSARFHAAAQRLPHEALQGLPRHDGAHYERCAERLEAALGRFGAGQRPLMCSALSRYRASIGALKRLPHGLIHNEYFGKNVVIRPEPAAERIAVVDWETAAIGLLYLDLTSLSSGRWTREQKARMWRGYFEQAQAEGGVVSGWPEFCEALESVALYQALSWLNWWSKGDDAHVSRWMAELGRVMSASGESGPRTG